MELSMVQITETTTLSKPMVSRSDVLVAAYLLGKSHNISKLARLMGKGETVLANKLNPECDSHHLNLGEAVAVTELTDDNAILEMTTPSSRPGRLAAARCWWTCPLGW